MECTLANISHCHTSTTSGTRSTRLHGSNSTYRKTFRRQTGTQARFHYDRAFRREGEVNNVQDWSVMRTDLYNIHTSAITRVPDVYPYNRHRATKPVNRGEATGTPNSLQFCLSWNEGSCISPRATYRFRHACNIGGCGQSHRRIDHHNVERRDKRRRSPKRAHRRSTSRSTTNFPFIDSSSLLSSSFF